MCGSKRINTEAQRTLSFRAACSVNTVSLCFKNEALFAIDRQKAKALIGLGTRLFRALCLKTLGGLLR
jgi:hypothetical protein